MAVSATMAPYVRRFVHDSIGMMPKTRFIHRPIDRPNIYLAAVPIAKGVKTFEDLAFAAREWLQTGEAFLIPQTIIFMDNKTHVCQACSKLWEGLPDEWRITNPMAIAEMSTALSDRRRSQVMQHVRSGVCRILVATEVAGMGVDFPLVERVIQWTVPSTLSISGLWQRFGRCTRGSNTRGVAVLMYTASCIIPQTDDHPLAALATTINHPKPALRLVEDFTAGRPGPRNMHDELEDDKLEFHSAVPMSLAASGTEAPENEDVHPTEKRRGRPARAIPSVCRGILWFLNSPDCRREPVMRIFDESGFAVENYRGSQRAYLCCDKHTPPEELPADILRLMPVPQALPDGLAVDSDSESSNDDKETDQHVTQ